MVCGILVPRPGFELWHLVVKTWSPNHWPPRNSQNLSDSLKIVRAEGIRASMMEGQEKVMKLNERE